MYRYLKRIINIFLFNIGFYKEEITKTQSRISNSKSNLLSLTQKIVRTSYKLLFWLFSVILIIIIILSIFFNIGYAKRFLESIVLSNYFWEVLIGIFIIFNLNFLFKYFIRDKDYMASKEFKNRDQLNDIMEWFFFLAFWYFIIYGYKVIELFF